MEAARFAEPADLPDVVRLVGLAVDDATTKRGGELLVRLGRRGAGVEPTVEADLADPDVVVILGTIDEVPVGVATVSVTADPGGTRHATVHELFVEPGARAVGVGEAMMALVARAATDAGATTLSATALPGDRATKNFFESNEMVARAIVVGRALPPAGSPTGGEPANGGS